MGLCTFRGGVHPYDGKELSKDKPITQHQPRGELVYPLSQHIGAPAKPVVAVGDTVRMGQMIAEAGGFVSAPVHATVSGTVRRIEPRRVVVGDMVDSIVIENDGEYRSVDYQGVEDVSSLSKKEIIEKIRDAGIVGMGGAGFPTHVKLSPKEPDKIDYVIANCAECEPYLTSDYRRMLEEPESLIGGMKILLSLFDNARGIFAIEDNKPDCVKLISEMVANESRMEVCRLRTKYPQGSERHLIYATTKRAINATMLPADAGCIVDNVDTVVAIHNAVHFGWPLMRRIVTVTGDAVSEPANFSICIGTNYRELVDAAGGFKAQPKKIVSGGPMMGFALFSLDIPTTKTTSALLCMTEDEVERAEAQATNCIGCGRCVQVCPSRIVPSKLADFAETHREEEFETWNGLECVECGSCSFICPAKRNLVQAIRVMKKTVLANKRKKA